MPVVIIAILLFGLTKRVDVYGNFVLGAKKALPLSVSIFPYLFAMFLMVNTLNKSTLGDYLVDAFAVPFSWVGVPSQLVHLILLRPFSGSGSLAILSDIYVQYGVDSYIGKAASVIMGSSETVFYISSVYFAQTKVKNLGWALSIALFCNLVGGILATAVTIL